MIMEKKEKSSMRKEWFDYVRKVRKKMSRGKGTPPCTHRQAMSAASESWPTEKVKIQNVTRERLRRSNTKINKKTW